MKATIGLDLPLDLTRNKVDIDQFTKLEEKNSPMYGESISNLYTETSEYDNRALFDTNGNRFHYLDGKLYMNDIEVLDTKGNGHFERKIVSNEEWDTYDKDNEGNELKSKYSQGTIKYYYNDTEYTVNTTDAHAAIIDCRARILNGTPIIAYVFIQTAGTYEFIYINLNNASTPYKSTGIRYLKQAYLTTSQKLANATSTTGTFQQDRSKAITTTFTIRNSDGKGFVNPLIQISNPLENVFIVSFLSDHGGKINPKDIAFYNIVDNNGTCSNELTLNTTSGTTTIAQQLETNIYFTTKDSRITEQSTVYAYPINSGWPQYDQEHAADIGKYFKTVYSDGQNEYLKDEVVFDPGTEFVFQNNVTGTYGSGTNISSYTKYQTFSVESYTDQIEINGVCDLPYNDMKITWPYTPKVKTWNAGGDTYYGPEFSYSFLRQLLHDQKNINIPATIGDNSGWFIPAYTNYLNDTTNSQGLLAGTFEPVEWDNTAQQYVYNRGDPIYIQTTGAVANTYHYPDIILSRAASSEVAIDGPVYYIDVFLYNENLPSEVRHIVIEAGGQTIEYDQVITHPRHVRLTVSSEMAGAVTFPNDLPMALSCGPNGITELRGKLVYATSSPVVENEIPTAYNTPVRMFTVLEDPYITWVDGNEETFETVLDGETQTFTWTFKYEGNGREYSHDLLFEDFINKATIVFDHSGDPTASPQSETVTTTDDIGYKTNTVLFSKEWHWTIVQDVTQIIIPTVALDDGTVVTTAYLEPYYVLPTSNYIVYQARLTDYNNDGFDFSAIGYYNTQTRYVNGLQANGEVEACVMDASIDINMSYYRYCLHLTNRSNAIDTTTSLFLLYDCANKDTYAYPGSLAIDTTGSQWITAHYYNNQGSIAKQFGKWRALINSSGLISGLSYGEDEYIGTLLTEWNSVSEDKYLYFTDTMISYKSTDGKWYEIEYVANKDGNINIIFDRYIIINTEGFWNCYDIEKEKPLHYATDFNNRVMPGISMHKWGDEAFIKVGKDNTTGRDLAQYFVSGINSLYEVSQCAITSIQISPQAYLNIVTSYESFLWSKSDDTYQPQWIEVFYGESTSATAATYQYSIIQYNNTAVQIVDSSLVDLNSPVAIAATTEYSPNIFTEYIHTYNNKDLIKNGSYGYPIIYNETTPILSYSSGKQISNVDAIFVIQSQFYAVIGGKIVSVTYDDYTIIGIDAIIDINGMVFLGYLPTAAYFWSPADRCIYTFTGDANLDIAMEANRINEVYKCYYSTMKEAIFITTDQGIYIITGKQQWHLPYVNVDNIYFLKRGYFIVESYDTDKEKYIATAVSYEKDKLQSPVKQKAIVETKFNGPGDGQVATTDKIQIVLISDTKEKGELTLECQTFTDVGFKSDQKVFKIDATMWDNINNALVLNYTPKYATGQGMKFKITSDFPIARMTQSINEKKQNTSTRNNM